VSREAHLRQQYEGERGWNYALQAGARRPFAVGHRTVSAGQSAGVAIGNSCAARSMLIE
jgi:hypothetical protein